MFYRINIVHNRFSIYINQHIKLSLSGPIEYCKGNEIALSQWIAAGMFMNNEQFLHRHTLTLGEVLERDTRMF